jgi:hypothetical protein
LTYQHNKDFGKFFGFNKQSSLVLQSLLKTLPLGVKVPSQLKEIKNDKKF